MKMIPVESSNLREVGYDPERREMRVVFKSGAVHDHVDVPPEEYAGLMSADSHGKRYNERIKGIYTGRKMGGMTPLEDDPGPPADPHEAAVARYRGEGDD